MTPRLKLAYKALNLHEIDQTIEKAKAATVTPKLIPPPRMWSVANAWIASGRNPQVMLDFEAERISRK